MILGRLPASAISAFALLAACAAPDPLVPAGARIGPQGFATILSAPPAPHEAPPMPAAPGQPTPVQLADQERFRRAAAFQAGVMEEVQALAERLRREEADNFVDLYFDNDDEPQVVFRFLRDPAATLARYSRHPRFRAARADYSMAELEAAMDFMLAAFGEDRVIESGGIGNRENRAVITINVPEDRFRALAARKGIVVPPAVDLRFPVSVPPEAANRPLPPDIGRLVRIFPRDDRPAGLLPAMESRARIVLRDGCFRVAGGDQDGALILFPLGASLFVDRDDFLSFGSPDQPDYARVGEEIVTPGTIAEVEAPALVAPIRAACGAGKVVKVNGMRSASADRAQRQVEADAAALRQLRETYGLSEVRARRALDACRRQSRAGACFITPPPPVARQADCPAGTRLSFGLCRTPEGHVRPLPAWIAALGEP